MQSSIAPPSLPSALVFLPPPPPNDPVASADFARDWAIYQETRRFKDTPRWAQATYDADYDNWPSWFAGVLGQPISAEKTPATHALFKNLRSVFGEASHSAKSQYQRERPFAYAHAPGGSTCTPGSELFLRTNGSYPSGHTSFGWGMALLLAEIVPQKQDAILKRGYEFGQSRVICGVHWQSDVDAGRLVGAAVVAQLHNSAAFMALLAEAKKEWAPAPSSASPS
ncbi:MAG: phosphatase PAP2 family protein [Zoogloeaceae bacterium]|nr:phosphatase PAP2 family protein [Zoogloeaceae bacterium]